MQRTTAALALVLAATAFTHAQSIEPEEFVLDNGMRFLLLPRDEQPLNIAAGWVAKVGSVNEPIGMSGISHFLEHMMFKGSPTIGTSDAARDAEIDTRITAVRNKLFERIYAEQYPRYLRGEIEFPWDPAADTDELRALRAELTRLEDERKAVTVNNEFDKIYTAEGASGMNAQTFYDWTRYFITIPSNKLELWAWLESDRLMNPTFREFDAEKDVVVEERRQRLENAPTGELDEQFESMVWMATPYNWPVIGWPTDLQSYTLEATRDYYRTYYQPSNLVGVIVGDFDVAEAKQVIESYFGRMTDYGNKPKPVTTMEIERMGSLLFTGECDCQPQVQLAFQGVPEGHKDQAALDVLAAVFNGLSGRLFKDLVEDKQIASSAQAFNYALKYAGAVGFTAEVKGDSTPEQLEDALRAQIEQIRAEPISERELQKIKNQYAANAVRSLQSNMGLLQQMLVSEVYGSWRDINEYPSKIAAVTAEDVRRVAEEYLDPSRVAIARYTRKGGAEAELTLDAALADLPEEMRGMMRGQLESSLAEIAAETDPAKLREALEGAKAQSAGAPPMFQKVIRFMTQEIEKQLAGLESAGASN